jgi:hypothetical protein
MVSSLRLAGAIVAGTALAVPLAAQKNVPATYAITNARIVPLSGPVIDKGTIVVRGGVIAAVGATVTAPADARIVDGAGLTVYPGLIDAYGTLGQAVAAAPAGGSGGRSWRCCGDNDRGAGAPLQLRRRDCNRSSPWWTTSPHRREGSMRPMRRGSPPRSRESAAASSAASRR